MLRAAGGQLAAGTNRGASNDCGILDRGSWRFLP